MKTEPKAKTTAAPVVITLRPGCRAHRLILAAAKLGAVPAESVALAMMDEFVSGFGDDPETRGQLALRAQQKRFAAAALPADARQAA